MEVLTPVQELPAQPAGEIKSNTPDVPGSFGGMDQGVIDTLNYLGLNSSIFDEDVMDKVKDIADNLGDRDIQEIDLNLGNPHNMTKLDKIYSYIQLNKQSAELLAREELIQKQREKYNATL